MNHLDSTIDDYRTTVHVLGIAGSLREGSYNRSLLRAAGEELPEWMTLEIFELDAIPLYNEDLRAAGFPEAVANLRERIAAADALLVATPEYNHSIPGVLKNAIDWASRRPESPLPDKPVALTGVAPGGFGTVRAQAHLRQVLAAVGMHPLNHELLVSRAKERFDADGRLVDDATRTRLGELLTALRDWTRRLRGF